MNFSFRLRHLEWIDLPIVLATILLLAFRRVSYWLQYQRKLFPEHWSEGRAAWWTLAGCCAAWGLAYTAWLLWRTKGAWHVPFVVLGALFFLILVARWLSREIFGEDLD